MKAAGSAPKNLHLALGTIISPRPAVTGLSLQITTVLVFLLAAESPAQLATPARKFAEPRDVGIHIANLRSGQMRFVAHFYDWSISPNGGFVAGGVETSGTSSIYEIGVVALSTGKRRTLSRVRTSAPPYGASYHWSPDSRRVTVLTDRDGDGTREAQTFTIAPATRKSGGRVSQVKPHRRLLPATMRHLLRRFSEVDSITFSPDGRWCAAYCRKGTFQDRKYSGGIWIFRVDGSGLQQVTRNISIQRKDADDGEVRWLPNGFQLAFRRTSYEDEGI